MDFYPAYNAFMSSNPNCKLRVKEGYVKSANVPGTGKKGYISSTAMTAHNVEECKERSDHRAEQRQNHADTGGAASAQRDRVPPGHAPDPELKMQGIESTDMSYKWFSCTVATPGRHMPTSFCTVIRRWILTAVAILKAFLVIEIGEDKHGFTASARRNDVGRGRGGGRGGGRGRGRGRSGAFGGPDDEMNSEVGWRHCHFMLLFNCPDGFDSVLTTIVKNLIHPIAGQIGTHFCIKEFGYGQTPTLQAGYLQKDKGKDHFQSTSKGISEQELQHAVTAYDKKKLTFWAGKQELHKQSLFTDCYRWFTRMFPGQYPPHFIDVIVMMIRTGEYYPSQQWVLLPTGITSPARAQEMWHLMFRPQTCSRRDVIMIFFTDQKGSLYRSEIENIIDQMVTKMGPEETELTCKEKQPLVDSEVNDEDGNVLDIGTNMPEHFDDDEMAQSSLRPELTHRLLLVRSDDHRFLLSPYAGSIWSVLMNRQDLTNTEWTHRWTWIIIMESMTMSRAYRRFPQPTATVILVTILTTAIPWLTTTMMMSSSLPNVLTVKTMMMKTMILTMMTTMMVVASLHLRTSFELSLVARIQQHGRP